MAKKRRKKPKLEQTLQEAPAREKKKEPKRTLESTVRGVAARQKKRARPVDALLDWRFNLVLLILIQVLIVLFFFRREITIYKRKTAQKALLAGTDEDYTRAYRNYLWLNRKDPLNPLYLRGLGDAALGMGRYENALEYYKAATNNRLDTPSIRLQVALAYHGLAQTSRDPKEQARYLGLSRQYLNAASTALPRHVIANYWKGMFALWASDMVEAGRYFARVRPDVIPNDRKPNSKEQRYIEEAHKRLAQIENLVFGNQDYSLDLEGLTVKPKPPKPPEPVPPSTSGTTSPLKMESPTTPTTATAPTP
jgi:tetratricopeptide (TPR) repeat protein